MMINSNLTEGFYTKIRKIFISETREKIAQRRELLAAHGNKEIREGLIGSFYLMFHSLKGTGQTIGFGDISTLAGDALNYLESLQKGEAYRHPRQVLLMLKSFLFRLESLIPDVPDDVEEKPAAAFTFAETGRVLVVDDDNALLLAIKERLLIEGVETVTTNSGSRALSIIEGDPDLDVLVIDIVMPDMDGIDLCRKIRENVFREEIPIIFLTAEASLDSKISGFEVGGDDYLSKPFALDELVVRVKTMIKRRNYFRQLGIKDPLTNSFNRRYFFQRLSEEIARCQRSGSRFSIFILDIDDFKKINDTFGHPAGDKVLVNLADFLQGSLRKTDVLCRLGGDEFAILFSDTPTELAVPVISRLKKKFADREFCHGEKRFFITFSLGGAEYPTNGRNEEELIAWADREMYRNKKRFKSIVSPGEKA